MLTLAPEIESKYEILQKMGEGGMGAVYKVRHRFLDEIQVVKLMQAKFSSDSGLRERFLREAKTAKQLRHPNIAEVIDFSITSDGTAYIVMEFIEGVNLRDVLTRAGRPLDPALVVSAGAQALRALGFLHRKKFVHRDISPDNLMLTHDDDGNALVKLIDLGITKSTEDTDSLTMAGQFVGKIHYASPEQFGGKVDGRSDLYSFGVVLYELLTAKRPIDGRDYLSVIAGHTSHPPRPFTETDPHDRIPPPLRNVVLKALEKAPADRFQTADEFAAALAAIELPPSSTGPFSVPVPADGKTVVETTEGSGEGAAWRTAVEENSVGAWESFLESYPKSNRAGEAKRRIEEIEEREEADWQKATQSESSDAVRAYLEKHGESTRAGKAQRLLEKFEAAEAEARAWEAASQVDAVTGWEVYLSAHHESSRAADARKRLDAAKRRDEEGRAWKLAEASDSVPAWRDYLKHCGDSPRAAEANRRLKGAESREVEEQAWNQAVAAASAAGWETFLRTHPNSSRAQAARAQLAQLSEREAEARDWATAVSENTAGGWQRYINQHPRSPRLKDAAHHRQETAALEERRKREAAGVQQRQRDEAARQEEERKQAAAAAERERAEAENRKRLAQVEARAREAKKPEEQTARAPIPDATQIDPYAAPIPPQPFPKRLVIAAGAAAAIIAIIVAVLMLRPDPTPPEDEGKQIIADTQKKDPQPPAVDVIAPKPSVTEGRLVINASPWAEVRSVKGPDGKDYVANRPAYTPLVLTLPPGAYTIELANPNVARGASGTAQVKPGTTARYDAEIDTASAEAYLQRLSPKK